MNKTIVSPFLYDWLTAWYGGASPYLARKRAELKEGRRTEAMRLQNERDGITDDSWSGIELQILVDPDPKNKVK